MDGLLFWEACCHSKAIGIRRVRESAWKANQCLLMIWINCFEDGWTSVLIRTPPLSPRAEVLYSRVLSPCWSFQIFPLLLWVIESSLDGNLFTLCSACQIADTAGGREVASLSGAIHLLYSLFSCSSTVLCPAAPMQYLVDIDSWVHTVCVLWCFTSPLC